MNKTILMGRITKDIELKLTPSGVAVCNFSIAVYKDKETSDFFDIVAWKKTAEHIKQYFCKGQMIAIVGRLQTRTWQDDKGNKRKSVEVVADEAHFCGGKQDKPKDEPQNGVPIGFEEVDVQEELPF